MENKIISFLLIGQSNMAGRGYLRAVKQIYDEQIKMLVNGRWQTMSEPINPDRPTSGISLAGSFAGAWRMKNQEQPIGLIPCAEGGSSLDDWAPDGPLFQNAVFQSRLARRISNIGGILWHQGENDSFGGRSDLYFDKLDRLITAFRRELQIPDVPLIIGALGDFLSGGRYGKYFTEYQAVNKTLENFAEARPNTYFVTASGLTANADGLHFDAGSLRKFGIRYFQAYDSRENILIPPENENERVRIIEERPLTRTEQTALLEISFSSGKISVEDFEARLSALNAG